MSSDPVSDDAFLDAVQRAAWDYFPASSHPLNGLVPDNSRPNVPVSIAVVGFALTAYPVGVERSLMSRAAAVERTLTTLRFFAASEQSTASNATGYKGFYYHFLDMQSGQRAWNCELSSIDTALLIAGVLTATAYFQDDNESEAEIRQLAVATV